MMRRRVAIEKPGESESARTGRRRLSGGIGVLIWRRRALSAVINNIKRKYQRGASAKTSSRAYEAHAARHHQVNVGS